MISKVICIGWTIFCAAGLLVGINAAQEVVDTAGDPWGRAGAEIGMGLGFLMWLFFWGIVVAPTALLGMLFRKKELSTANKVIAACLGICFAILTAGALTSLGDVSSESDRPSPSEATAAPSSPVWRVNRQVSKLKDSHDVFLSLDANETIKALWETKTPTLVARCMEDKTEVYVDWQVYIGVDTTMLEYRLDKERAQSVTVVISTDSKATFLPKAISFLRELNETEELVMRITPYGESPVTVTFDVDRMGGKLDQLRQSCHW